MDKISSQNCIAHGKAVLGIELGSTRIKSVLIGPDYLPLASGSFSWENKLENGLWTYSLENAKLGLQASYMDLIRDVKDKYGLPLRYVGAIGISGMMHGYLPFDKDGKQLAPFLTWRNTNTSEAASKLSRLFGFNIPLRWSIAQLYQAMLDKKQYLSEVSYITTLSGYLHWQLTGEKVLGIGDASGMFPIDPQRCNYDERMLALFDEECSGANAPWRLRDILPKVLVAGETGGYLSESGARLLDPTGELRPGVIMAPPEGDAGTGMTATNSVAARTGNVSAGTSIFSMVVLEKPLSKTYPEVDIVTTPSGRPVAMIHCNNCTGDMNEWVGIFRELSALVGCNLAAGDIYSLLFKKSLTGDADCGGIVVNNYQSGEPITGFSSGCPLVLRLPNSHFDLANFMRAQIYTTMSCLVLGMEVLTQEQVAIDRLFGHGGLFKTEGVCQQYMADALNAPISVMDTAGEGGPYGMALLAAYLIEKEPSEPLEIFLAQRVYKQTPCRTALPDPTGSEGYGKYLSRYYQALHVERAAVEACV